MARALYTIGITADVTTMLNSISQAEKSLAQLGLLGNMAASLLSRIFAVSKTSDGLLNLGAFSTNLKATGNDLTYFYNQLRGVGLDGRMAFNNVASAIVQSLVPLKLSSKLLDSLWVTMKNTMKWQLTSSMLRGFLGSIETAFGYSKSLDSSLNNIRIVTKLSADEMAVFAENANKAAKALNTTTTDYTNASLVYYQLGLSDEEVLGRTETTIKLANVSRLSAEEVSLQLTSVWNNFYDGSKSLEYYADVMVALGAATASSSDEIAQGVQKFAAVAETVGLSYETAAAALATVTATTRESADVVGTAYKTLFARIQGLLLGETMDDGTDLNKYSEALYKVGINIKDVDGQLRDMDSILFELGDKWKTLAKDQQVALAETVAGVRLYTQLVALMDSWDYFKENLSIATGASGELSAQAEVYAESWEAARKNIKAGWEDLFDSLVNPDFFIGIDKIFTPILTGFAKITDAAGGFSGIMGGIFALINKVYGDKIATGLTNMANSLGLIKSEELLRAIALRNTAIGLIEQEQAERGVSGAVAINLSLQKERLELSNMLAQGATKLSESQYTALLREVQGINEVINWVELLTRDMADSEKVIERFNIALNNAGVANGKNWLNKIGLNVLSKLPINDPMWNLLYQLMTKPFNANLFNSTLENLKNEIDGLVTKNAKLKLLLLIFEGFSGKSLTNIRNVSLEVKDLAQSLGLLEGKRATLRNVKDILTLMGLNTSSGIGSAIDANITKINALSLAISLMIPEMSTLEIQLWISALERIALSPAGLLVENITQTIKRLKLALDEGQISGNRFADLLVKLGTLLSSLSMFAGSMRGISNLFEQEDINAMDVFTQILMTLTSTFFLASTAATAFGGNISAASKVAAAAAKFHGLSENFRSLGMSTSLGVATNLSLALKGLGRATLLVTKAIGAMMVALGPYIMIGGAIISVAMTIANAFKALAEKAKLAAAEDRKALLDEINSNLLLSNEYNDLLITYLETGTGKEELSLKAIELASKLGIEGAAVTNLTGDYEALSGLIDEVLAKLNKLLLESYRQDYEDVVSDFGKTAREGSRIINVSNSGSALSEAFKKTELFKQSQAVGAKLDSINIDPFASFDLSTPAKIVEAWDLIEDAIERTRAALMESGEELGRELDFLMQKQGLLRAEYLKVIELHEKVTEAVKNDAIYESGIEDKDITTLKEYEQERNNLNDIVLRYVDLGDITEALGLSIITNYAALSDLLRKLEKLYLVQTQLKEKNITPLIDIEDMSETELEVALLVIPNVTNAEQFATEVSSLLAEASKEKLVTAFSELGPVISNALKDLEIDEDAYKALGQNADFIELLKDTIYEDMETFSAAPIADLLQYLMEYFSQLENRGFEALEAAKLAAEQEKQVTMDKIATLEELEANYTDVYKAYADARAAYQSAESDKEKEKAIADWEEKVKAFKADGKIKPLEFNLDITNAEDSIDGLVNKLGELEKQLKKISKQKYDISMDWSDVDAIMNATKSFASFIDDFRDNATKVGNSYQIPINAMYDWMKVYPDLFAMAEDVGNGIMAINVAEAENFMATKENEIDNAADTSLDILDAEAARLEGEIEVLKAEYKAVSTEKLGELDLENMVAEKRGAVLAKFMTWAMLQGLTYELALLAAALSMGTTTESIETMLDESFKTNVENATAMAKDIAIGFGRNMKAMEPVLRSTNTAILNAFNVKATVKGSVRVNMGPVATAFRNAFSAVNAAASALAKGEKVTPGTIIGGIQEGTVSGTITSSASGGGGSVSIASTNGVNLNYSGGNRSGGGGRAWNPSDNPVSDDFTKLIEAYKGEGREKLPTELAGLEDALAGVNAKRAAINAIKNQKLTAPSGKGGSGGGGGGGGGGGSDGEPTLEELEEMEDLLDRYHEINRELEYHQHLLEKIEKVGERAYGLNKLRSYKDLQEELNKIYEKLYERALIAAAYKVGDLINLQKFLLEKGMLSAVIDPTSYDITNYIDIEKDFFKKYQDAHNEYEKWKEEVWNKLTTQSAQEPYKDKKEELEKAVETAKENLDRYQELAKTYESSVDQEREDIEAARDTLRSIKDLDLDLIELKFLIVLDIKDAKTQANNFVKDIASKYGDALSNVREDLDRKGSLGRGVASLMQDNAELEVRALLHYQQLYDKLLLLLKTATDVVDRERIMKDLKELQASIISSGQLILEFIEYAETMLSDAIDAAAERFAKFTDLLEHNTTVLDTIKELYTLLGVSYKTEEGYNTLVGVASEKLQALMTQAKGQRLYFERAREELLKAEEALANTTEDNLNYNTLKNNRDALLEQYNEAQEAMLSSAQEAMQTALDMYTQALEKTIYDFGELVSNGMGLDLLQDKYDHYIDTEERYLDKVNEAYQTASWYNKLLKDIDNTTDKTMQDALKRLQDEINMRRENNKLSLYDLDILEAKYKVLQAQMELEDAMNSQNELRLVRDRLGNWNYLFTADADKVADAENNLLDAENEWYNIAKNQMKETTGEIISTMQECSDKINEIWSDMTLTEEEKLDRTMEIRLYYAQKVKDLETEKLIAIQDMTEAGNKSLIDMAILNGLLVEDLTGITAGEVELIIADSGASVKELLLADNETIKDIVGSNTELIDLFKNVYADDLDYMTWTSGKFEQDLDNILDLVKNNWSDYKDRVAWVAGESKTDIDNLAKETDRVAEATDRVLYAMTDATTAMWDELSAIQELSLGMADYIEKLEEALSLLALLANKTASDIEYQASRYYDPNLDYHNFIEEGILSGYLEYGSDLYNTLMDLRKFKIEDKNNNMRPEDYIYLNEELEADKFSKLDFGSNAGKGKYTLEEYEKILRERILKDAIKFDTGGYTGEFDDARLAFLHQKELVLNSEDTENILQTVSAIREIDVAAITKALDLNATLMAGAFNKAFTNGPQISAEPGTLELIVRIEHVEFPNATSSDEIQDAFESLVNDASQWARRRRD